MQKMLMCFDGPVVAHMSQMVPLAKCFQNEFEIDCIALNPVTYQLVNEMPFISNVLPLKYENGIIFEMSLEDGITASTDFYYTNPGTTILSTSSDTALNPLLKEKLDSYDKILMLYDEDYAPIKTFFQLIFNQCKSKCMGRFDDWTCETSKKVEDKYIPQDVVESFGFQYHDKLLGLEYDWYNKFNPNLDIKKKSVCVTFSGGCETYIPDIPNRREYNKGKRVINLLKSHGFQVVRTNRKESVCRQVFYSLCQHHIGVDSPMHWMYKCFKNDNKNAFSIQPLLHLNMEKQLRIQSIAKSDNSPEGIVKEFLLRTTKILF